MDINLEIKKVSDRVYYLPKNEEYDWCTLGLVIGEEHVLMIDAGASERHVKIFLDQLEKHGLPKPDMCALTHWHWDHTYGLWALNVVSFATKDTNDLIKSMAKWNWSDQDMKKRIQTGEDLAFSYDYINKEYPDKSKIKIEPATVEYKTELDLNLGGLTVKLRKLENSHSYDSAIIYVEEEKCIFLGDIHYEDLLPTQPVFYSDKHRQLITALRKFDFDKVVAGHQELMTNVDLYAQLSEVDLK